MHSTVHNVASPHIVVFHKRFVSLPSHRVMAPTYSPLGSDENQRAHHGQRTPVWIRILWFFQAGVALLRICLVGLMLVAALLIASMIDAPALVFVFVILYVVPSLLSRPSPTNVY
jgi:small-conductance mechanosensitive channel